jgi:hypothetical protein
MDKTQIIIIAVTLAVLSARLYQKYIKKNKSTPGSNSKNSSGSSFPSSSRDDDYEPYSKK